MGQPQQEDAWGLTSGPHPPPVLSAQPGDPRLRPSIPGPAPDLRTDAKQGLNLLCIHRCRATSTTSFRTGGSFRSQAMLRVA